MTSSHVSRRGTVTAENEIFRAKDQWCGTPRPGWAASTPAFSRHWDTAQSNHVSVGGCVTGRFEFCYLTRELASCTAAVNTQVLPVRRPGMEKPDIADINALLLEDLLRGADPGLEAYQRQFPGHEDLVETVYFQFKGTEKPREKAGSYRIKGTLGRGGGGTVYHGEHHETGQRVAIKFCHDDPRLLERFTAEYNALRRMDHPNIARVVDVGEEGGQPFIVTELIHGAKITQFCHHEKRNLEQRLRLFQQVCEGIQHAHSRAILHRDIKPGNVLVSRSGETPRVKIVDFGLAKALGGSLTKDPNVSVIGQIMGSPNYMSPEQAGADNLGVDVRTDVYSLGVLLAELLTGSVPFDLTQALDWKAVQDKEPERPSSVVARLSPERRSDLIHRLRTHETGLIRRFKSELDWVVLKCLDGDRDRRYETVRALWEDVDRFLNRNEPLVARPPSLPYRAKKLAYRFRTFLVAVAMVVLTLTIGFGWALFERTKAERLAKSEGSERRKAEKLSEDMEPLVDVAWIVQAREIAETLWPLSPETRPRMEEWLRSLGDPLVARLPRHEKMMDKHQESVETTALLFEESLHSDADLEALREQIESMDLVLAAHEEVTTLGASRLGRLRSDRETLRDRLRHMEDIAMRRQRFQMRVDEVKMARGDTVVRAFRAKCVEELRKFLQPGRFGGAYGQIVWRLKEIDRLEEVSLRSPRARDAWAECQRSLAQSDLYDYLNLAPQFGLLPMGKNPRTQLWEFWHVATGEEPIANPKWRRDPDDQTVSQQFSCWTIGPKTGIILVLIPGGRHRIDVQPQVFGAAFNKDMRVTRIASRRELSERIHDLAPTLVEVLGVQVGDRVLSVDGQRINDIDQLKAWLNTLVAGDPVELELERAGKEITRSAIAPTRSEVVELDSYFLSKYETTHGQWGQVLGTSMKDARLPITNVSYREARDTLFRVGLSLPTEAQWEVGARGGTLTRYWWGRDHELGVALEAERFHEMSYSLDVETPQPNRWLGPARVGHFRANPFGLHDVLGNVSEWSCDRRLPNGLWKLTPGNGLRVPDMQAAKRPNRAWQMSNVTPTRVGRGGDCTHDAKRASVRTTLGYSSGVKDTLLGIRAVRLVQD